MLRLVLAAALAAVLICGWIVACAPAAARPPGVGFARDWDREHFDHGLWERVLARCGRDGGVDYAALRRDRRDLDEYLYRLAHTDPGRFAGDVERLLFWVNAYNACTLGAILDTLPADPARWSDYRAKDVPGFFARRTQVVAGRARTLDQIEGEELRGRFGDPRIHLVLVCGAKGCPALRPPPGGDAAAMEAFLDESARQFLRRPANFHIDRERKVVHLSRIFDWYRKDFEARYGSVVAFLHAYAPGDEARAFLAGAGVALEYVEYDWGLNR